MAAAGLWWQRAVGVLMMFCAPAAHAASQARLVVVPSHRTQAVAALEQFAQALQQPLANVATVVPTAAYTQAAQKALLGPNLASGSAAAVLLGTQVGASHVLYLRATSEQTTVGKRRKRTRERLGVAATLVDVATGETTLSHRYLAGPRGLTDDECVQKVVADVQASLTGPSAVAAAPSGLQGKDAAAGSAAAPVAAEPIDDKAPPQKSPQAATSPRAAIPVAAPRADRAQEATQDPYGAALAHAQKAAHGPDMTLGLRAQLGLMVFARQATLSSLGVPKLQYGVSKSGSAPVFSRGNLQVEVFPVMMVRRHRARRLIDGLGLHIGGALGWPKTRTSAIASSSSLTSNLRVGLTLRHLFGERDTSPEVAFRLGYARYAFAMPQGAPFPSLSYSSVALGLGALVPLGTPMVALAVEAALMPALSLGSDGALLGVHRGGGVGAWVEAGFKVTPVKHLDILALFAWEHYGAQFVGSTLLTNSATQYASVGLRELLLGGRLALGTTF